LAELQHNLNDISARYDKDVIVVEIAYAFTDQEDDFLSNIANSSMAIPGLPVYACTASAPCWGISWQLYEQYLTDAAWAFSTGMLLGPRYQVMDGKQPIPIQGNAWENQALFDYD
jgi:arabinogalactan endo-1,4-beta-galactosidase